MLRNCDGQSFCFGNIDSDWFWFRLLLALRNFNNMLIHSLEKGSYFFMDIFYQYRSLKLMNRAELFVPFRGNFISFLFNFLIIVIFFENKSFLTIGRSLNWSVFVPIGQCFFFLDPFSLSWQDTFQKCPLWVKYIFFFEINLNHRVFEKFQRLLPLRQGEFCLKKLLPQLCSIYKRLVY